MDDGSTTTLAHRQQADERMFDAELAEVLGVPLAGFSRDAVDEARPAVRRRWLEAALVLLGLAVTAAVVLHRPGAPDRRTAQAPVDLDPPEPQPMRRVLQPGKPIGTPAELGSLTFRWYPEVGDLDVLLPCQRLRYLWLLVGDPPLGRLEADCLEPLARLPQLETLVLELHEALDTEQLEVLRSMPRLRFLSLQLGRPLTAEDVTLLRGLEHLVGLELQGTDAPTGVDAATIRGLASMPQLQSLGLSGLSGCDEAALQELRAFHGLRRLSLSQMGSQPVAEALGWVVAENSSGLTESVARALGDLPLLEEVRLDRVAVTPGAIRALPKRLTGLRLTCVPDAGAEVYEALGDLPGLRRLGLDRAIALRPYTRVADALPTAEEIERSGMAPRGPVFGAMAELLRGLPLTELAFEYPMPPEVREALAAAENLTRVRLVHSEAADVAAAARAPALRQLHLESCESFALKPLQQARSLRELHLRWVGVASEDWLREQLPEVRVVIEN